MKKTNAVCADLFFCNIKKKVLWLSSKLSHRITIALRILEFGYNSSVSNECVWSEVKQNCDKKTKNKTKKVIAVKWVCVNYMYVHKTPNRQIIQNTEEN